MIIEVILASVGATPNIPKNNKINYTSENPRYSLVSLEYCYILNNVLSQLNEVMLKQFPLHEKEWYKRPGFSLGLVTGNTKASSWLMVI